MPRIGQQMTPRMAQHVRVAMETDRLFPRTGSEHLGDIGARHWSATLADEHESRFWLLRAS